VSEEKNEGEKRKQNNKPNHLAAEKSPYLLEHAFNPVDWYPWGHAAFEKAKAEDKPIFLSIGYSTCHWCHVMRDESFEDEKTAAILNDRFVPIKVDREERPDIDEIYMKAVTTITGQGGWPLSVFLTPDLKPFYGGTYFPPVSRHGLPSFPDILNFISDNWDKKRQELVQGADDLTNAVRESYALYKKEGGDGKRSSTTSLSSLLLDNAYAVILSAHDHQFGGFGRAPKFPLPSYIGFLLLYYARNRRASALNPVIKTLDSMADGGIHDHLAGGFHRYSTDRYWLVPHFEKMLYDNARLAKEYSDAYRVTRAERYASVARDVLDWILDEMTSPEGGFYSAQDADTPDGEGYYYTWTPAEVSQALGNKKEEEEEEARILCEFYGITPEGNFEGGRSILSVSTTLERTANKLGVSVERVEKALKDGRAALLSARRTTRKRPAVDDKILVSWNGLAISGFACAYQALQEQRYLSAARKSAEFVLERMVEEGRSPLLYRRYRDGDVAIDGNLEDYSFFIAGLLDLYEASLERRWISAALMLCQEMVRLFWDAERDGGGFFLKPPDGELVAIKEGYDGPTPSGNSVAALDLLRLSEFTGNKAYRDMAERTLRLFTDAMESSPSNYLEMLAAVDFSFGSREIVIAVPGGGGGSGLHRQPLSAQSEGEKGAAEAVAEGEEETGQDRLGPLLREIQTRYLPTKVLALAEEEKKKEEEAADDGAPPGKELGPLTEGKLPIEGKPTVYVCENFACKAPVTEIEALRALLDTAPSGAEATERPPPPTTTASPSPDAGVRRSIE
jgi:uncharacterized protein YyaL (SSP411 family)